MSAVRSKLARILGITSAAWIAAAAQAAYPERPIRIVVPLPTGVAARHIPMNGSTESVTAVAGSQVDYTITAITNALPMIHAGKLRALGVTGPGRHPARRIGAAQPRNGAPARRSGHA